MTMKNTKILTIVPFIAVVLCGCNNNSLYNKQLTVDKNGWNLAENLRYDVDIDDTLTPFDFYIDIRNNRDYAYSNLFLFITTTFPDKVVRCDTLECPLADTYGKWYGKTSGKHIDGRYLLHKNVIFPIKGTYTFQISHGMRDTLLHGVKNVGLHAERSQN